MRKTLTYFILLLAPLAISAQSFSISGTVTEADTGMPLPGVNITVKNTEKGVVTDFDGNYTIDGIAKGDILVFSYISFNTQEFSITAQKTLDVAMKTDSQSLDQVVVIGYGAQKRKELTGSVSTVDSKTIDQMQPTNVAQSIQGTVSGVDVTPTGGAPGSESNIRIRGVSTNGQNQPLIILDGFQYEQGLNSINPQDIESITVLKDAQAAIYGTIGANGVILITTKKGRKNQKPVVSYEGYTGIQQTTRKLPLLNATEYALLLNESYANAGRPVPFNNVSSLGKGTDWQDEVFETSPVRSHNISVKGGGERTSYSLSASNLQQKGIVAPEKSNFKRSTAKLSLDTDINDFLNFKTKLFYTNIIGKGINDYALGSVLFNAANIAPTIDPSRNNLDGTINLGNEVVNPLTQIDNTYNKDKIDLLSGTFQATLNYAKNIKLEGRFGFNKTNTRHRDFAPIYNYGAGKIYTRTDNLVNQNTVNSNSYTFDLYNTYENTFAEDHHVTFLLGLTSYEQNYQGLYGSRKGVQANSWKFADLGSASGTGEDQTNDSYKTILRRLSYFARLQYDFRGKYLISGMLRRDSSTRFGPSKRVAYFPSVTAGWVISDENFFKDNINFVNLFKLRGSYGVLGNDRIGNNRYRALLNGEATYVLGQDQKLVNGNALGGLANPNIQWEEAKKTDVGVDLEFSDGRFSLTADYFLNKRDDLLVQIPVSGIYGTGAPGSSFPFVNAGSVENRGFEFAAGYSQTFKNNFSISVNYNISTLKNEVTELNGVDFIAGGGFGVSQPLPARMEVGKPIGYFLGYKTNGIFQNQAEIAAHPSQFAVGSVDPKPGDIRYVDVNVDGVVNIDDRTEIGDPIPDLTMGLNLSMNYKNFDFSTYVYSSLGGDIVRNFERAQENVNRLNYHLDRWTGEGTSNSVPRVTTESTANKVFSDFFVEDASFARIQTVTLGYTLPQIFKEKDLVKKIRLYGKVDNVYTFTKYSGYDVTASTGAPIGSGFDDGFYPLPRTFIVGVNLKF